MGETKMITTEYTVDMLYYSPSPEVSCDYLRRKVAAGGFWINIFGDTCETRIVSATSMTVEEYRQSWLRLTGDCYKMEDRYTAMTSCPLLVNLYSVCELP